MGSSEDQSSSDDAPIVESKPDDEGSKAGSLEHRIHQQRILTELGVMALGGASLDTLLNEAARLTAEGLQVRFSKVLEYLAAENQFLVRAGVGWDPGIVGVARVGADLASPAGFALRTGKPVISNQLENEERFRTPELLEQHGVKRAMNVILQGDGVPFGVLEVDSQSETAFDEDDLTFLQGAANLLGMAIERQRHERALKTSLQRHQILLKELNHRVKNSLTIVVGMLRLQARALEDANLVHYLDDAAQRVTAIARAHDQLYRGSDIAHLDLGEYIEGVCRDIAASIANIDLHVEAERGLVIETDRAIPTALIVNELIANAAKYAYGAKRRGSVWVTVASEKQHNFKIAVRDGGVGLPEAFNPREAKGLGMRIVNSFTKQLGGALDINRLEPGTEFVVTIPRTPLSRSSGGDVR